jgi:dTDP-4-amino-4,6-dideoxygalactose transaminase
VIVPARTFIATASCAVSVGARPVFVDVDPDSQNLTAATVRPAITARTKAVIAVHLAGWPAAIGELLELTRPRGIALIEDCAQAHGATLDGQPVGSLADIAAWSFCQDKILTTGGEGGMITTNDPEAHQAAWAYKDHGKSWAGTHPTAVAPEPGYRGLHDTFGTNARMHELAAAVGRAALPRLPADLARRRANAAVLHARLGGEPALRIPVAPPAAGHSYYRWYAFLRPDQLADGWTRDRVLAAILAEGIPCSVGSCGEIYLERAFPLDWRPAAPLPVAAELAATSLAFPVHPTMTSQDLHDIAGAVVKVLAVAS